MTNNWTPLTALQEWTMCRPDDIYMVQPRGGQTTEYRWSDVRDQAARIAEFLRLQAFPAASNIAVISRNCAESVIVDLAIWMAGHVSVQVYPSLNAETLHYILEHCEAKMLFLGEVEDWECMQAGVPDCVPIVRFPGAPFENLVQDYLSWQALLAEHKPIVNPAVRRHDELARLIYTSGSTGKPKGTMISFAAKAEAKNVLRNLGDMGPEDRLISYLPMAHAFESAVVINSSFHLGCRLYFSEGLATFAEDLRRARPTVFQSVPRLWVKFQQGVQQKIPDAELYSMLDDPKTADALRQQVLTQLGLDATRIAITGSAPLPPSVIQWYRRLGLELLEGYGMTEDYAYSHITRPGEVKLGYVGTPLDGVQSRLSAEGEIQIKSPARMQGYYKQPDVTAEAFTEDGWFRTGDLGEFDAQGRLRISGRLKELFKTSKGKYVAPAPIENRMGHPLIESICVSGASQPQPHALMVLNAAAIEEAGGVDAGQLESEINELLDNTNAQLDPHERLAFAVLLETPWTIANGMLTPTMKLKRNVIEAHYAPSLESWYGLNKKVIWEHARCA